MDTLATIRKPLLVGTILAISTLFSVHLARSSMWDLLQRRRHAALVIPLHLLQSHLRPVVVAQQLLDVVLAGVMLIPIVTLIVRITLSAVEVLLLVGLVYQWALAVVLPLQILKPPSQQPNHLLPFLYGQSL